MGNACTASESQAKNVIVSLETVDRKLDSKTRDGATDANTEIVDGGTTVTAADGMLNEDRYRRWFLHPAELQAFRSQEANLRNPVLI